MPIFYQVTSSSDLEETQITSHTELDSTQIYIIIVDEEQIMYIWRGSEAPNRMKFVSSRAAAQLRVDRGGTHSVQSIDQGQETQNFLELFEPISHPARSVLADEMRGAIKGLEDESMEAVMEEIVDKIPEESSEEFVAEMPSAPSEETDPFGVPDVELPSKEVEEGEEAKPVEVPSVEKPSEVDKVKDRSQISFEEATDLLSSLKFSSSEDSVQEPDVDVEPIPAEVPEEMPATEAMETLMEEPPEDPSERIDVPAEVPEEMPATEAMETLMEKPSEDPSERIDVPAEVPEEMLVEEAMETLMEEPSEDPSERIDVPTEVPEEMLVEEAMETLMEEPREKPSERIVITAEVPPEAPVEEAVKTLMSDSSEESREGVTTDFAGMKENLEVVLKEYTIPDGYIREFIISQNQIFSIVRKEVQLLGVREERLEPLGELPDGAHPVKEYLVRLLVKDGNILAVEFLRRQSPETAPEIDEDELEPETEHERSELLSAMRQEVEGLRPKR